MSFNLALMYHNNSAWDGAFARSAVVQPAEEGPMAKLFRGGAAAFGVVALGVLVAALTFPSIRHWFGIGSAAPPRGELTDEQTAEPRAGFRERAREAGITFRMHFLPAEQGEDFKINLYDHGCGLAIADFDSDGHDDIYFVNQLGPNALFRNKGDGTFEDVTGQAGVGLGDRVCVAAAFADYDNDGHPDLFVTSTRGGNVLFHNEGNGTFRNVTKEAGVEHIGHSQTAVFFDYDNDGRLDLFVTNTAEWTTAAYNKAQHYYPGKSFLDNDDFIKSRRESNILYRNNGNGTFTDVTDTARLKGRGWGGDVAVLDYDEDGRLDLLVTNMFGPAQLYRNNGDGTFTDVTKNTLGATSFGSCGARAFDFNNDGRFDLFLADMHSDMWMGLDINHISLSKAKQGQKRKYPHLSGPFGEVDPTVEVRDRQMANLFGYQTKDVVYGNTLFENLGDGKFQEVSDHAGLETFWPWGAATGDFDNDGYEDVFMPSGMGYPFYYWPNQLCMNNGDGTFTERAEALGIEPPQRGIYLEEKVRGKKASRSSRCAAVADFDGDGRLEIVVNNFNDYPYYFRNNLPRKNWIAFRLRGTKSNRDAIGAVVKLHLGTKVLARQLCPVGGYLSQSSRMVHFGLGEEAKVDRVEIRWPSGAITALPHPTINQLHKDIIEE
jgi:hypothetical protein